MAEVVWAERALSQLEAIVAYIADDSPMRAGKVQDRLLAAPDALAHNPRMGRRVPEFKRDDLRELIVRPYRILYHVEGDRCTIVAVIHGKRNLKTAFRLDDLDRP